LQNVKNDVPFFAMARRILEASEISERQLQRAEMRKYLDELTRDNPLTSRLEQKGDTELLTSADVDLLWHTLETTIPVMPENEGIYQHLCDSSAFAARLADLKPDAGMTPAEAAFIATVRNAGMLTGQKEYFRKSMVSHALAQRMGVRDDLKSALLPLPAYVTPRNSERGAVHYLEDDYAYGVPRVPMTDDADDPIIIENAHILHNWLNEQQRVMEMAGLLAKRDAQTGQLLTFDEVMSLHVSTRMGEEGYRTVIEGKKILWPSAYRALKDIEASRLAQSYAILYTDWLGQLKRSGYDHETVRKEIDGTWDEPEYRLQDTKEALIAYLDAA
jgi:hypothetical protein